MTIIESINFLIFCFNGIYTLFLCTDSQLKKTSPSWSFTFPFPNITYNHRNNTKASKYLIWQWEIIGHQKTRVKSPFAYLFSKFGMLTFVLKMSSGLASVNRLLVVESRIIGSSIRDITALTINVEMKKSKGMFGLSKLIWKGKRRK